MTNNRNLFFLLTLFSLFTFFVSCKKNKDGDNPPTGNSPSVPSVIFKFHFDSTQARLDNLGNIAVLPANHSAQSPKMNKMCAHYVELTPTMYTALGAGKVLYHAPETNAGGATAIDHAQSVLKGEGEEFLRVPISSITPGTYNYLRVSLAYQNYDIRYKYVYNSIPFFLNGTIASFVGYNTYISSYTIKTQTTIPSAATGGPGNHLQGYWGFETTFNSTTSIADGQSPPGATTVPNPIWATSPIPAGSCLVTGAFSSPLVISGNETSDIIITVSLSTNNSFEWKDANMDGWFEPAAGDTVVNMGIRGLIPIVTP
jgi:hypothetical protein